MKTDKAICEEYYLLWGRAKWKPIRLPKDAERPFPSATLSELRAFSPAEREAGRVNCLKCY